jgi:diguanylate cyclase (GGDEF)-like protein/PAS domain S-box-containing protein
MDALKQKKQGTETDRSDKIQEYVRQRRKVELLLRESEKKYRDLLAHLPVGIYRTTPDGRIIEANPMLAELLGFESPEQLRNVTVSDLYVQKSDRKNHLTKLDASQTYFTEFELKRRDGKVIWVRDYPHAVMGPEGQVTHYTGILVDISEQRETEKQLHGTLVALETSNRERQSMITTLESLSLLDDLTQLYNRRGFFAEAQQQLQKASQQGIRVFFLFMDLDNLKWINDSWGHQKGDLALTQFAGILKSTLRRADTKGRLGGDEFAVLAQETEGFSPRMLIERIHEKVDSFNSAHKYPFPLSISMGVSYFDPQQPSSLEELMVRADKLMYEQKRAKHIS